MIRNRARFCGVNCACGFAEDRRYGAIYGPYRVNGVWCRDAEEWSLVALRCAYCNAPVPGRIPARLKVKFGVTE